LQTFNADSGNPDRENVKGKGSRFIYLLYCSTSHSRRSGTDHTVLPANYTVPASTPQAFTRWRISRLRLRISNCSLLLIYLLRKDERLSRPGWLTNSGRCTHETKKCVVQNVESLREKITFLSRVSTLTLDIDIAILSVRPSVCLYVCLSVMKTA